MEEKTAIPKRSSKWLHIFITQIICVGIIILGLLLVKLFFKDEYLEIKKFYKTHICNDTSVSEVLEEVSSYEI